MKSWRQGSVVVGVTALAAALLGQAIGLAGVSAGWLLLLAGILAFAWQHSAHDPLLPEPNLAAKTWEKTWRAPRRIGGGIACLFLAVLCASLAAALFYRFEPHSRAGWLWLGVAVAAALGGAALFDQGLQSAAPPRQGLPELDTRHWPYWLAGILALAAVLRFWHLGELPFGLWFDEAAHGLQALRILRDPSFWPVFEGAITGPAHHLYLVALAFKLFGVGVLSIRLVSACFGVAAALAAFLLGSELFGRRLALVTAAFVAVSSWAITLSRFGLYATMSTPFFTLLTAALLLRALRTQRLLAYAWAGLAGGLGLCFYTSFRLFVPVVALFLVAVAFRTRRRQKRWPCEAFWAGMALFWLLAALVASPVAVFAIKQPDVFWARVQETFIFADKAEHERWPALWHNVQRHFLMFNVSGDPNGRHNLPRQPMLDPVTGTLFAAGVTLALRFVTAPRHLLLLLWLGFGLLGGVLSLDFEAPQSLRANATLPAAYVLSTLPLAALTHAWLRRGHHPRLLAWAGVALTSSVALFNIHRYFIRQANHPEVWSAHSTPETLAARELLNLDPTTDPYVTCYFAEHPALLFLLPARRTYHILDSVAEFPLEFAPDRSALLILGADSFSLYEEAQRLYPRAVFTAISPPSGGRPVFLTVRLSPQDLASIHGVTAQYFPNNSWSGDPSLTRIESGLAVDWRQSLPVPLPFSVEWEGSLAVPASGKYEFVLEAPAGGSLFLDGDSVLAGSGRVSAELELALGVHKLRLRAVGDRGEVRLLWRPPNGNLEPVPEVRLYHVMWLAHGLLGRYFANDNWQAPEAFARIDRRFARYFHVVPLERPYTVEWTGRLAAPRDGLYTFGLESIDESALWIDDTPVVATETPNTLYEGQIQLRAGPHAVRIRYVDRTTHTHINVYWQPPGGETQILPFTVLSPQ